MEHLVNTIPPIGLRFSLQNFPTSLQFRKASPLPITLTLRDGLLNPLKNNSSTYPTPRSEDSDASVLSFCARWSLWWKRCPLEHVNMSPGGRPSTFRPCNPMKRRCHGPGKGCRLHVPLTGTNYCRWELSVGTDYCAPGS